MGKRISTREAEFAEAVRATRETVSIVAAGDALRGLVDDKPCRLPLGFDWRGRPRPGRSRVMACAEGYAMVRNAGGAPFVVSLKEIRAALAALAVPPQDPAAGGEHGKGGGG